MIETAGPVATVHVAEKNKDKLERYLAAALAPLLAEERAAVGMFMVRMDQTRAGVEIRIDRVISLGA